MTSLLTNLIIFNMFVDIIKVFIL